jgi:hypothetical protein
MEEFDVNLASAFIDITAVFTMTVATKVLQPSEFEEVVEVTRRRLIAQGFSEDVLSEVDTRMATLTLACMEYHNGQTNED